MNEIEAKTEAESSFRDLEVRLNAKGTRWILLGGIPAKASGRLNDCLTKLFRVPFRWFSLDLAERPQERAFAEHQPGDWLVIDAFGETDQLTLTKRLKNILSTFPDKRVLVVGDSGLEHLTLPAYLGEGEIVTLPYREIERDDSLLLQHARRIEPKYGANDLVLTPKVKMRFEEAISHIRTKRFCEYEWGFRDKHSRGHGVTLVFHGPSGTGKTMGAEVIARELGMTLYQIDLSSIVSKWVGETEKNLKGIFRAAQGVNGILLFDEGDAIFGQRTNIEGSNDRYSNLEVNFLLQEIETFDGVAILSTNHEKTVDPAFLRRFTYAVNFGYPDEAHRRQIWQKNLPAKLPLGKTVDLNRLALFPLTGGKIKNCIRQAAGRARARNADCVEHEDFLWGLKRELQKHGEELSRDLVGEDYWMKVASEWEYLLFKKNRGAENARAAVQE